MGERERNLSRIRLKIEKGKDRGEIVLGGKTVQLEKVSWNKKETSGIKVLQRERG